MSRQVTAPRGVTTFNDLSVRSLSVNGQMIEGGNKDQDWFKGQNPYIGANLPLYPGASTPSQAATLAQVLANKLATYLVDSSVVAKNCNRIAVSNLKATYGAIINIPGALATGLLTAGGPVPGWPVPYLWDDGTNSSRFGGSFNGLTFGSGGGNSIAFGAGANFVLNPAYVLQSDALIDFVARNMAVGYLDGVMMGVYNQFTSIGPVGTSNSTLAAATLTSAIALIQAVGNFIVQTGTVTMDASGNVTGSGTAFTSSLIGQLFKVSTFVGLVLTVTDATHMTVAIAGQTASGAAWNLAPGIYQNGMPIFFALPEQNAIDLNTVALEPDAGYIATDYNTGRRRIYSGGVMAEIFFTEKAVITGGVNKHGLAFCPPAIALVSAAATASNIDPSSGSVLTTAAIASSAPVDNFVASVKYGLTGGAGGFVFNVLPNAVCGYGENNLACRVES